MKKNITYYTVYKVTNEVNGKIYIGCHKTKNLDDGYMGSGKYLKRAIEKHGLDNFKKEILFVYDNSEDMFSKEAELVTEDYLTDENTYNLNVGGYGGFDYINKSRRNIYGNNKENLLKYATPKALERIKFLRENDEEWLQNYKTNISNGVKAFYDSGGENGFLGKTHTEESKAKMSKSSKGKGKGNNNSQYGTRWIHSLTEKKSKKINKDDNLPRGWLEGRKMKFD